LPAEKLVTGADRERALPINGRMATMAATVWSLFGQVKFVFCSFVCLALSVSSFADILDGNGFNAGNLYKISKGKELCSTEEDCILYNHFLTTGEWPG
jgi:hypothetical protein